MGVHGLWQLLHPSGRPVTLESLEGKVLAVDVSIWLHQSMKGMRDKDGNALPNAHLQGLFSRVCKLLFYRIKPVFVFDGGVPDLKKQTLAARREKKSDAMKERDEIGKKLLENLIKSQAVKQALGSGSSTSSSPVKVPGVSRKGDRDLFELAPLPEAQEVGLAMNSEAWVSDFKKQENWIKEGLSTLSKVDPDSVEFKSLPMEIQHEALVDLKEERKYHSLSRISKMPEDSDSFSNYQLKKLMKVSNLTTRIEGVRKDMANRTTMDLRYELGGDFYGGETESRRIVSEDASHYILIKGLSKERQLEEAEKYDLDRRIKIEKEEEEPGSMNIKKEKTLQSQEASSSPTKRQIQEKDDHVTRKRLKYDKKGGDAQSNSTKGALLSTAFSNNDDDDDEDGLSDRNGEEPDEIENSSSEDEGFIEVTFDPKQAAEEDDLFPASIFATGTNTTTSNPSYPSTTVSNTKTTKDVDDARGQKESLLDIQSLPSSPDSENSPVQEDCHKDESVSFSPGDTASQDSEAAKKKKINPVEKEVREDKRSQRRKRMIDKRELTSSAPQTADSSKGKVDITEKRKSVLSDIMAQLKKQKETLESLSVDESDVDVKGKMVEEERELEMEDALSGGFVPEGGSSSDESDHDDKGKWGRGTSGDKTLNAMEEKEEEDYSFSGGFIREESSSGDEGYLRNDKSKRQGYGKIESGPSQRRSVAIQCDDDDGDVAILSTHEERSNDSEDEDLNLAIELSLQTARQVEDVKGGRKSDSEGASGNIVSLSVESEDVGQGKVDDDDDDEEEDDDDFEMVETVDDGLSMENDFVTSAEQITFADENDEGGEVDAAVDNDFDDDDDEVVAAVEVASLPPTHKSADVAGHAMTSSEERLQPEDVTDPFMQFQQSNLQNIREELTMERSGLLSEQGRQDRFATSLTDQIVLEAQELLNMFGIPYIVSPMEAEAQCAFLDATGQTQGTITDDSDIWLFGGTRVYKNFFNQTKFVEFFSVDSIKSHFGLTREQLIKIALLCGSDYTVGIQGVGPVRALEIMGEFRGDGLEGLMAFRKWWDKSHKKPAMPGENKLRTRLKQLSLEGGFPSERVMEAYLCPAVDESRETFSWGQPDLDHLRHIAKIKFGWSKDRSDSVLDPMMKQLLKRKTQGSIRSYFQSESYVPSSTATAHSDRIKKALSVMQSKKIPNSNEDRSHDQNDRCLQTKNVKNTVVRKKRRGSDENGSDKDGDRMVENMRKTPLNKTMKTAKKDVGPSEKKTGGDDMGKEGDLNSVRGGDGGVKSGKVLKAKGKVEEKKKGGKGKNVKQGGRKELDGVVGDSGSGGGVKDDGLAGIVIKTETGVKDGSAGIVIKTEPGFDYDGFMKDMREKVAKASSLLDTSTAGTGKRGGRGRGRGGNKAKGVSVTRTSGVPSLEKRGVRSRSQRGKTSLTHNAVRNRGVICLSESSSSDSGSDDDDSGHRADDFDVGDKVDFVDIENKIHQHSKNIDMTNSNNAVKLKSSRLLPSSKSDVLMEDLSVQGKEDAVPESSVLKSNLPVRPSTKDQAVGLKVDNKQIDSRNSQVDRKRESKELQMRNEAKRVSPLSKDGETEGKKLKKNDVRKDDGLVKSKNLVDVGLKRKKDNSESDSDRRAELNQGMEGMETKGDKVVGQVEGKNPDVSIINAMTLKATMSYLNQRSLGEKHLLNALGGKRPTNAVERRLEEEERRRKRGGVDYIRGSDGRESGGVIHQKEVKKSKGDSKHENQKDPGPKLSFEDMLGGTEVMLAGKASKLKSTSRQEKSNKSVIEKSATDRKSAKKKEDNNRVGNGDTLKSKEDGNKSKSKGVGGRNDDSHAESRKVRMKSCSDESGSEDNFRKGKGGPVKDKEVNKSKSRNSNTLNDVPVTSGEGEIGGERGLDKFGLQVSHLWDKQSVKGHGVLPRQGRSKKSQMFDMPLDGSGMAPSKIESKKKQVTDVDADTPPSGGGGGFVDVGGYDWGGGSDSGLSVAGDGRAISRGRAIAGKGKGIGKNRNGRQARSQQSRDGGVVTDDSLRVRSLPEIGSVHGGSHSANSGQDQVSSVLASSGVTDAEIMEFGCMTTEDLGSDFDDDDF